MASSRATTTAYGGEPSSSDDDDDDPNIFFAAPFALRPVVVGSRGMIRFCRMECPSWGAKKGGK
jgi:hypothetical protein